MPQETHLPRFLRIILRLMRELMSIRVGLFFLGGKNEKVYTNCNVSGDGFFAV